MPEESTESLPKQELPIGPLEESGEEKISETKMGDFLSPIAFIMFLAAGLIDLIGFVILCFGLDDFGIMDLIGLIFVGSLMYIHSQTITATSGTQKTVKKFEKKILKRLGLSFLGELIPYFGNLAPCWTLAVYFQLKES